MPFRRLPRPLIPLLLAACLACNGACKRSSAPPPAERSDQIAHRVRLFLVAPGPSGCDDDEILPVEVNLESPRPALEGALDALVSLDQRFEPTSGLYNALYGSRLRLKKVARSGSQVRVDLTGYLEVGGPCDASRILSQLQGTALQFEDLQQAQFYLEGNALDNLLAAWQDGK